MLVTIYDWDLFCSELRLFCPKRFILLALLSVQRSQTLQLIGIRNVQFNILSVKIYIGDILKQTRPEYHLTPLEFKYFTNESLCVDFPCIY